MKSRPSSRPALPSVAPAILPRICAAAGWTQAELAEAVFARLAVEGHFSSFTDLPSSGISDAPSKIPMFDIWTTRECLKVELQTSGHRVCCHGAGSGFIYVDIQIPDIMKNGAIGNPLSEIVYHELLDSPDFVIRSMTPGPIRPRTIITFDMPNERFPA